MTTKWVDGINDELEETPTRETTARETTARETTARETTKSKWTGLVVEPLTSIYDKVIKDIETEYETYAKSFSATKEGFEYEIDNTPIYATRGPEEDVQEQEVVDPPPVQEEPPPSMNEDEKSQLMTTVADIFIKIITILATLFVAYNLYYNMKKTGQQIDFYENLSFLSFGPFYVLTGAMLKTVKFVDEAMTDVIPSYLQKLLDYTNVFGDRTLFGILFMVASIIVNYLKGEIARIYTFIFKNKMTGKSLYKFLFKTEGNKSVAGLLKAVFIYYYLFCIY